MFAGLRDGELGDSFEANDAAVLLDIVDILARGDLSQGRLQDF
jgi:hypothetical protein